MVQDEISMETTPNVCVASQESVPRSSSDQGALHSELIAETWRKNMISKVLLVHTLQSLWIGSIISIFLFIPEIRVAILAIENGTSNNAADGAETNWHGVGAIIGFTLAFCVIFVATGVCLYKCGQKIWKKRVLICIFLFSLATTFGLSMATISMYFKTEIVLVAMILVVLFYLVTIAYVQLTKYSPFPFRYFYPALPPLIALILATTAASVVSYIVFHLPFYNALISFGVSLLFLLIAIAHTWTNCDPEELDESSEPIRSTCLHVALRMWHEGTLMFLMFCCLVMSVCQS